MKTSKIILAVLLPLVLCFATLSVSASTVKSKTTVKHAKHHKRLIEYFFEIQDPSTGDVFCLHGHGTPASGTVNDYVMGCDGTTTLPNETCTGSYTYNSSAGTYYLTVSIHLKTGAVININNWPVITYNNDGPIILSCQE